MAHVAAIPVTSPPVINRTVRIGEKLPYLQTLRTDDINITGIVKVSTRLDVTVKNHRKFTNA